MFAIDDDNFERLLAETKVPVMLVFKSDFCGPSALLDPLVEQVTKDFEGKIIVADIDVENCPKLTKQMEVRGTPSLVVLNMGIPLGSRIGTMSYKELVAFVEKSLCQE